MHILCLHGLGTNSKILEAQTAALRYELGDSHSYDYAEGTIPVPIDPALAQYFPASDECFAYFNPAEPSTFTTALDNLEAFIEQEGPFDAILGYSHGAQLAASMLARANMKNQPDRPIKCAFFLSGGIPYTREQRGADGVSEIYYLDPNKNGTPVDLPTAHIWGENDTTHPGTSVVLSELCKPEWRAISIHGGGHEIPGASSREYLIGAVKVIRKTVDLAVNRQ